MTYPGWYPDPVGSGQQRYWDGRQWGVTAPAPPTPAPPPKRQKEPWGAGKTLMLAGGILVAIGVGAMLLAPNPTTVRQAPDSPRSATRAATPSKTNITDILSPDQIKDAEFIASVMAAGIQFHGDKERQDLLDTGQGVCLYLDIPGNTHAAMLAQLMREQPSWSPEQIGKVARAAIDVWCPSKKPK